MILQPGEGFMVHDDEGSSRGEARPDAGDVARRIMGALSEAPAAASEEAVLADVGALTAALSRAYGLPSGEGQVVGESAGRPWWAGEEEGAGGDQEAAPGVEGACAALLATFERAGVRVTELGARTWGLRVDGSNGVYDTVTHVDEDGPRLVCYVAAAYRVPAAGLAWVADFVRLANVGLPIGNFEFDADLGEVRFKTSLSLVGVPLTPELVANVVDPALAVYDAYFPWLLRVSQGDVDPLEAVTEARTVD